METFEYQNIFYFEGTKTYFVSYYKIYLYFIKVLIQYQWAILL